MNLTSKDITNYAQAHSQEESPLLKKIHRETWLEMICPQMMSPHLQGRILSLLSKLVRPRRILELGTFTGYGSICLCEGLTEGGKMFTIDINPEIEDRARGYFKEAGLQDSIVLVIGDALEVIPTLNETWDLVFIDANKASYPQYYRLVVSSLRPGGLLVADNVLWSDKVVDPAISDPETDALREFSREASQDDRLETLLLPVRDGIMICRKVP